MAIQVYEKLANNSYLTRQSNLTYSLGYNGKISSIDAMEQAIYCILMTERYSNPIYDSDYGVELEQYLNKDLGFIKATIENTLKDALKYDERVSDVIVTSVERSKSKPDSCEIHFTVFTTYGELEETIDVST